MDQEIVFSEQIAPIIHNNCTPCHRPGEAGPFKLITYRDVAKRAKMVKFVTETRYMPPWPADRNYTHFLDEWGLSDNEILMIKHGSLKALLRVIRTKFCILQFMQKDRCLVSRI